MGCGGSRADAIEPRYYESWTRETESTWLTYTDSDALPSAAAPDPGPDAGGLHAGALEDGLASTGAPRSAAPGAISSSEKRMSCGTQCPHPQGLGPGLHSAEVKRDAKRTPTEEVTVNVSTSIRPMDRSVKLVKNCVD
ncbi:brain and acute leukemia cytoplasmic protein [Sorex fumeus]|uniref:brain and acute leukemia cytoplasmic protein n=1 Tax=Sorex fumeus TaxID=62283 RepID=UPI0024AE453A|nr:brain and acute leukemia cytoplasmic protein [Sorex fumeus]